MPDIVLKCGHVISDGNCYGVVRKPTTERKRTRECA